MGRNQTARGQGWQGATFHCLMPLYFKFSTMSRYDLLKIFYFKKKKRNYSPEGKKHNKYFQPKVMHCVLWERKGRVPSITHRHQGWLLDKPPAGKKCMLSDQE